MTWSSGPVTRPRGPVTRRGPAREIACETAHNTACDTAGACCDTTEVRPRYGRGPGQDMAGPGHDTARQGWLSAQRARNLGHGCAYCALDPVLTQNTVLSHCLSHCSHDFSKNK